MNSIIYESLMKQAFQSSHIYEPGADALIYRNMEQAHNDFQLNPDSKTKTDKENDFKIKFSAVRQHVSKALTEAYIRLKYSAPKETLHGLEKMKTELTINFYNRQRLDEIILDAAELLKGQGLVSS